jgi:hypothetical protein
VIGGTSVSAIAKSPKDRKAMSVRPKRWRVGNDPSEQRVFPLKIAVGGYARDSSASIAGPASPCDGSISTM